MNLDGRSTLGKTYRHEPTEPRNHWHTTNYDHDLDDDHLDHMEYRVVRKIIAERRRTKR